MNGAEVIYKETLLEILKFPDPCDQAKLIMKAAKIGIALGEAAELSE